MTQFDDSVFEILLERAQAHGIDLPADWCGFDDLAPILEAMTADGWVAGFLLHPRSEDPPCRFVLRSPQPESQSFKGEAEDTDSMLATAAGAFLGTRTQKGNLESCELWDPRPTQNHTRTIMTLALAKGISMPMNWHGVNGIQPVIDSIRDDGCTFFIKFDGQRTRNRITLKLSGEPLGDTQLGGDCPDLLVALADVIIQYAARVPLRRPRRNPRNPG